MDKRQAGLAGIGVLSFAAFLMAARWPAHPSGQGAGQAPPAALKQDLAIGVEDGDENLMFGSISRIDLDGKGNIYILDYKFRKVGVFDGNGRHVRTIPVPEGQGPREATDLSGIAVTPGGTLFVNDMRKVIVYGPDGEYLRTFLIGFMVSSIGCAGTEELVAIGPNGGKILHVFSPEGKLLASFGETFAPPAELESMKDLPMFSAPFLFNCAKDGRVFVLNPHKYEVAVFKDRKLEQVIAGKSELFKPVQKMGRGFVSTAAHIVASGDLILVHFQSFDPKAKKTADVFRSGKQAGSLEIPGTPHVADVQGRIYLAEVESFPRAVRYVVDSR